MGNLSARQILANEIKKEVLMDLNRTTYGQNLREQQLVDRIRREVLLDLGQHPHVAPPYTGYQNRALVDAVKNEVLAGIRAQGWAGQTTMGNSAYVDRVTVETIKQEVIAQLEAEQETPEADPALVQAVKNSVLAEMNIPHNTPGHI